MWPTSFGEKALFAIIIKQQNAVYFDGSNSTNRILDVLEQERPKIILLAEQFFIHNPDSVTLLSPW